MTRLHANSILEANLHTLALANNLRPLGRHSLHQSMRNAMIAVDTTPHLTTPTPGDPIPTYIRPVSLAVSTKQGWANHMRASGLPPSSSPAHTHPTLTHTGLIALPHDSSQHDPNQTTLADHIFTGVIPTPLHNAITSTNSHTAKYAKTHTLTNPPWPTPACIHPLLSHDHTVHLPSPHGSFAPTTATLPLSIPPLFLAPT